MREDWEYYYFITVKFIKILRPIWASARERKSILKEEGKTKEEKARNEGQLDLYNYKLAEIAHELDKIKLEEVTPIDALNILSKIKEKMN